MKLAIKEEIPHSPQPLNADAGEAAEPKPNRSRARSLLLVLAIGSFLSIVAFGNLHFAESVIRQYQIKTRGLSDIKTTSWATLIAGVAFSIFVAGYVYSLFRQIDTYREAVSDRSRELQNLAEQKKKVDTELSRTRSDFDRRVQERTRELADSNKFMISEIAERKRAEAELASERERFITTLRTIGDGVIATDADSRVVLMNRVAEELTGWKQDEAARKFLYEVFKVLESETGQPFTQLLERVVASGPQPEFMEGLALVHKSGAERKIEYSCAPIFDPDGHISGIVVAFRDITERHRIEEDRAKTQKLESIALLAGGIAHDYNNLLTAILGNLSLAQMSLAENPTEVPSLLNEVESAGLRAKSLTHQLLTFAKGGAPIKQQASLPEMVKDSAEFVLRGSNSKCVFELDPETRAAEVDLGQISQVVQNIIINADQAMPAGGTIKISTENITFTEQQKNIPLRPGPYVKISISDTGPGMPKEVLNKIFEPYFTTKEKGSGLGLTTSFAIVKKHDGFLSVDSKVGEGTTFRIYLPASESDTGRVLGKSQPLVLRGNGKILAMDDEEAIRQLVKRILESVGYKVVTVKDGQEALDEYKAHADRGQPFDAVMLDLTVSGGMGGRECVRQLLARWPNAKAIVSSGYVNDPVMERYKKFGFVGMVSKPYTLGDLSYALKRILG